MGDVIEFKKKAFKTETEFKKEKKKREEEQREHNEIVKAQHIEDEKLLGAVSRIQEIVGRLNKLIKDCKI